MVSLWYYIIRGRPFDSEGGGGRHFLEINILTLKMLEINNLSSSGKKKKTNLNLLELGGGGGECKSKNFPLATVQFNYFRLTSLALNYSMFTRDSSFQFFFPARLARI